MPKWKGAPCPRRRHLSAEPVWASSFPSPHGDATGVAGSAARTPGVAEARRSRLIQRAWRVGRHLGGIRRVDSWHGYRILFRIEFVRFFRGKPAGSARVFSIFTIANGPLPRGPSRVTGAMSSAHVLSHIRPTLAPGNDVVGGQRIPRSCAVIQQLDSSSRTCLLACSCAHPPSRNRPAVRPLCPRWKQRAVALTDPEDRAQRRLPPRARERFVEEVRADKPSSG